MFLGELGSEKKSSPWEIRNRELHVPSLPLTMSYLVLCFNLHKCPVMQSYPSPAKTDAKKTLLSQLFVWGTV